ncbi:hypothetical protein [Limnohabitans sp. 2KL-27]|uniref:hypothetical protein n=1 Tax=Limnohabitans sp. 2KL-27 TaxID=1100705 RepID=UPI001892AB7C|nr:hypothetical protein [Limnohabitans sp. 2KL-27]
MEDLNGKNAWKADSTTVSGTGEVLFCWRTAWFILNEIGKKGRTVVTGFQRPQTPINPLGASPFD